MANAQCVNVSLLTNNNTVQGGGAAAGWNIDFDEDGVNDFAIFQDNADTLYILALDPANGKVLTSGGSGTAKNYAAGPINGAAGSNLYSSINWLGFLFSGTHMGPWGAPFPKTGFIGIKLDGKLGFIELNCKVSPRC
jgi:hypothetical protein